MFTSLKQSDNQRRGTTVRTEFGITYLDGKPVAYPLPPITERTAQNVIGQKRVMLYNKTQGFRPGAFSVNPVDQRSELLETSTMPIEGRRLYQGSVLRGKTITGDTGGYLGAPGSSSINTPPLADPTGDLFRYEDALVASTQAAAEAAVMLGEAEDTLRLLISPINGLASLLNKARNYGMRKNARRHRSEQSPSVTYVTNRKKNSGTVLSDWYLQNRFGVLPFLRDITLLMDAFRKKTVREWSPIMKKGSSSVVNSVSKEPLSANLWGYPVKGVTTVSSTLTRRAVVYYQRNYVEEGWQKYGLSLFQWPGVAWELVPLSFVVDRVIGIGKWLERIRPKYGHHHLGATISRRLNTVAVHKCTDIQIVYGSPAWSPCGHFSRRTTNHYIRDTPGPLGSSPLVNIRLGGLVKTLDHITLAWQRMPKLHKL